MAFTRKRGRHQTGKKQRGGVTPLWAAAHSGDVEAVREQIEEGADVNQPSGTFDSPPIFAAVGYTFESFHGQSSRLPKTIEILQLLLSAGADINKTDTYGTPIMYQEYTKESLPLLEFLLVNGADPNKVSEEEDTGGYSLLHLAVSYSSEMSLIVIQLLLEYGANPGLQTAHGETAIDLANELHDANPYKSQILHLLETVKPTKVSKVLKSSTNINQRNAEGYTILHRLAKSYESEESIIEKLKTLVKNGVDLNAKGGPAGRTPAMEAIMNKKPLLAQFLLDVGANVHAANKNGSSLLHYAAAEGYMDMVDFLIRSGIDVNVTNNDRETPLFFAARHGQLEVLQYLLHYGANVDAKSKDGWTPLSYLFGMQFTQALADCAEYLLQKGAVLDNAVLYRYVIPKKQQHAWLPFLLEHGMNPNSVVLTKHGRISIWVTALLYDVSLEYIQLFVKKGADLKVEQNFVTPLAAAACYSDKPVIEYLLVQGADPNTGYIAISEIAQPMPTLYHIVRRFPNLVPLVLEKGANLDIALYPAISTNDSESLRILLEAGANPDQIMNDGEYTILNAAIFSLCVECLQVLLDHGANVNLFADDGMTALLYAASIEKTIEPNEKQTLLKIIEMLVKAGADVNAVSAAGKKLEDFTTDEEILVIVGKMEMWKGWTQADITFLNNIFTKEIRHSNNLGNVPKANDYTLCPVCLKTTERSDGCMHMAHDCSALPGFYHKGLFERYKSQGKIHWCTICNRIGFGLGTHFEHYTLDLARNPIPAKAGPSMVFDVDCANRSGGGGLPEKFHRFQRLRQVAFQLNKPRFLGKKSRKEILEKLVEAMWDAPLVENPEIEELWEEQRWNIPNTAFPAPVSTNASNNTNIPTPAGVQDPIVHPVATNNYTNAITSDTENIVQFRHTDASDTLRLHDQPGQQISQENFADWLKYRMGNYSDSRFGYCWQYIPEAERARATPTDRANLCTAKLWPHEIRVALGLSENPEAGENKEYRQLYEGYKKLFQRKERGTL